MGVREEGIVMSNLLSSTQTRGARWLCRGRYGGLRQPVQIFDVIIKWYEFKLIYII